MEETLSEEEKKALRGSKFAPLPAPAPSNRPQPRLAHPGGPIATNKAAALAKFLERKLQQPGGIDSINPQLLELAVKNAKETVYASKGGASSSRAIRHVNSFGDSAEESEEDTETIKEKKKKGKKKKKKKKKDKEKKANMIVAPSPKIQKTAKKKKKSKS